MARTHRARASKVGISRVLSQPVRSPIGIEEEEAEEGDRISDPDEPSRAEDANFKNPNTFKTTHDFASRGPVRLSSNLDRSVKKYPQEKLPLKKVIPKANLEKYEESCINYVLEDGEHLSSYMKQAYEASMTNPYIDSGTMRKVSADYVLETLAQEKPLFGVYVLEDFTGQVFERMLRYCEHERRCRVIGPDVLIQAKQVTCLPNNGRPLIGLSMYGMDVCSAGFKTEEKKDFSEKITLMGGKFNKLFVKTTNVLIATNITSEKSRTARKLGIPIVTKKWVNDCWRKVMKRDIVKAADLIDKHRIPIFMGATFCISQIGPSERLKLEKDADKYGYNYQPSLTPEATHLICKNPEGPKFDLARERGVHTVKNEWIRRSIEIGYALPESSFMVGGPLDGEDDHPLRLKSSSRVKTTICEVAEPTQLEVRRHQLQVNSQSSQHSESKYTPAMHSQQLIRSNNCEVETEHFEISQKFRSTPDNSRVTELSQLLNFPSGNLLDNLEINLFGFSREDLANCRNIIARQSGFCSLKINDNTSFVLVSNDCPTRDIERLKFSLEGRESCHALKSAWLVDSVKSGRLVPFDDYLYFSKHHHHEETSVHEELTNSSLGFVVTKKDRSMDRKAATESKREVQSNHLNDNDAYVSNSQVSTQSSGPQSSKAVSTDIDGLLTIFQRPDSDSSADEFDEEKDSQSQASSSQSFTSLEKMDAEDQVEREEEVEEEEDKIEDEEENEDEEEQENPPSSETEKPKPKARGPAAMTCDYSTQALGSSTVAPKTWYGSEFANSQAPRMEEVEKNLSYTDLVTELVQNTKQNDERMVIKRKQAEAQVFNWQQINPRKNRRF